MTRVFKVQLIRPRAEVLGTRVHFLYTRTHIPYGSCTRTCTPTQCTQILRVHLQYSTFSYAVKIYLFVVNKMKLS